MLKDEFYIGIDIQIRRNCCYAVINETGILIDSGWLSNTELDAVDLLKRWSKSGQIYVGIDASLMPLVSKRKWYWSGAKRRWNRRKAQKGNGRWWRWIRDYYFAKAIARSCDKGGSGMAGINLVT